MGGETAKSDDAYAIGFQQGGPKLGILWPSQRIKNQTTPTWPYIFVLREEKAICRYCPSYHTNFHSLSLTLPRSQTPNLVIINDFLMLITLSVQSQLRIMLSLLMLINCFC